jgi:hypothetical protein
MKKTTSAKTVIRHKDAPKTTGELLTRIDNADQKTEYGKGYIVGVRDAAVIKNKQMISASFGWAMVGVVVGAGLCAMVNRD